MATISWGLTPGTETAIVPEEFECMAATNLQLLGNGCLRRSSRNETFVADFLSVMNGKAMGWESEEYVIMVGKLTRSQFSFWYYFYAAGSLAADVYPTM